MAAPILEVILAQLTTLNCVFRASGDSMLLLPRGALPPQDLALVALWEIGGLIAQSSGV